MSDIKIAYGTSTSITCTLASLADNGARECTAIDNTSNLFSDAMVTLDLEVTTTVGGEAVIYVWFYGSEDGTTFTDNATGSDAAVTMRTPTNLRGPFVISTPSSSTAYNAVIGSVASFFGGVLPRKWGFVIQNLSGAAFHGTEGNHTKTYTGIYYTNT